MTELSPLRRRMVSHAAAIGPRAMANGHDDPQSFAGDAAILRPCGIEVQPAFRALAG